MWDTLRRDMTHLTKIRGSVAFGSTTQSGTDSASIVVTWSDLQVTQVTGTLRLSSILQLTSSNSCLCTELGSQLLCFATWLLLSEFRAWGKSVLSEFAKYCKSNGVKFEEPKHDACRRSCLEGWYSFQACWTSHMASHLCVCGLLYGCWASAMMMLQFSMIKLQGRLADTSQREPNYAVQTSRQCNYNILCTFSLPFSSCWSSLLRPHHCFCIVASCSVQLGFIGRARAWSWGGAMGAVQSALQGAAECCHGCGDRAAARSCRAKGLLDLHGYQSMAGFCVFSYVFMACCNIMVSLFVCSAFSKLLSFSGVAGGSIGA